MSTEKGKIEEIQLDQTLDDIEDLPQYIQLPTGAYGATLVNGIVAKTIEGKDGDSKIFEMAFTITDVTEVDSSKLDEGEEMPKPGDIATFSFQRENKFGMGLFKDAVKPIAEKLGTSQIGALLEGSKGFEVLLLVTRKYDKERDRNFTRIKKITPL